MAKILLLEQFKTFFGKLNKLQKASIIGGVGLVLLLLVFVLAASSKKTEMAVLYSDMEGAEASKVIDKLKEQDIKYELKDNGSTILIDKSKLYETRINLAKEGLPETGVVGYELFDKTNLGMSEFVQKVNYRRAIEGELARTIKSLDEVKNVRVHIVIPEKALFEKNQKEPTASVTLHLQQGKMLTKSSVAGIQNLVANSVEGLNPALVTVIDQKGKILSEKPNDINSITGLSSTQHDQQVKVEQYLASKVQSMLDGVLGQGNSEVRVNAELDFTQLDSTVTDYDPQRQVIRSEQQIKDELATRDTVLNSSYGDTSRMKAAVIVNSPNSGQSHIQSNSISNYEIKKTVSRKIEEVGNIKRLSIAVMVNGTTKVITHEDGVKELQYIPRTEQEMKEIEQVVRNSVGLDLTRSDSITVVNVRFDTSFLEDEISEAQPIPIWKDPEYIKIFALAALILITLFIMYRILHSKPLNERMRIAMSLPEHVKFDEEDEASAEAEEELEEIELGEEQMMLLPTELPDQLLLEGEKLGVETSEEEFEENEVIDKELLASRAKAALEEVTPEMNEEILMKLEIKEKVQSYFEEQTGEAVRLIRAVLSQDYDERSFKF